MSNHVGGDKFVYDKMYVTAGANLVDKTFVYANGTVPANNNDAFGVVERDTAVNDLATIKRGIVEVIATGTVNAGEYVEILTSTFTTKDTTGVTGAGVQKATAGNYVVGQALTDAVVNETVLIDTLMRPSKDSA